MQAERVHMDARVRRILPGMMILAALLVFAGGVVGAAVLSPPQPSPYEGESPPSPHGDTEGGRDEGQSGITLPDLLNLVIAGANGDARAGQQAYQIAQALQQPDAPPEYHALGKGLQNLLEGLRGDDALARPPAGRGAHRAGGVAAIIVGARLLRHSRVLLAGIQSYRRDSPMVNLDARQKHASRGMTLSRCDHWLRSGPRPYDAASTSLRRSLTMRMPS